MSSNKSDYTYKPGGIPSPAPDLQLLASFCFHHFPLFFPQYTMVNIYDAKFVWSQYLFCIQSWSTPSSSTQHQNDCVYISSQWIILKLIWHYFYRISIKPTWYRSPQAVGGCTAHFTTCWNVGWWHSHSSEFFPGAFTTCQNVGWLHSHSSKNFPHCIYNLPKCCLITQPLFWDFAVSQPVVHSDLPCQPTH